MAAATKPPLLLSRPQGRRRKPLPPLMDATRASCDPRCTTCCSAAPGKQVQEGEGGADQLARSVLKIRLQGR